MKNVFKRGFTLVELLVVVLIIGILSSVALPQYQKAVNKSRVAGYWPGLKNLAEAQSLCKLEKGSTCSLDELDIEAPTCKPLPGQNTCTYGFTPNGTAYVYLGILALANGPFGRLCAVSGQNAAAGNDYCAKYGLTSNNRTDGYYGDFKMGSYGLSLAYLLDGSTSY